MTFKIAFGIAIIIGPYCMASAYASAVHCAETPLHKAARSGNIQYIQEAAANDFFAEDCHDRTPMHLAILYNRLRFIEALARADFDVNRLNGEALPILHYSVVNGSIETTKVLLTIGSIPNAINAKGETPLYLSLRNHDEEVSKLLVASGASITLRDNLGNTLAHAFAERKDLQALKLLVTLNGELDVKNINQKTPLLIAVKNNSPSIINFLLAHGASISKLSYLHIALAAKAYNSLRALLENGISTKSETEDGLSVIELAVKNELTEAVDILGSFRRDPGYSFLKQSSKKLNDNGIAYQIKDKDGNSVLHVSVKYNKSDMVKKLLSKHGEHNIDEEGEGGNTAMELAIRNDNTDIMDILASFGADISRSSQDNGSLLKQAIVANSKNAIAWLIDHGANTNEKDKQGITLLHIAAQLGKLDSIKTLLSRKGKFNVNSRAKDNFTPIFFAVSSNQPPIIKELLNSGADIEAMAGSCHVLAWAAYQNVTESIFELLSHPVDLDSKCESGNTALIFSTAANNLQAVKKLLELGADVNIIGEEERSAFIWATVGSHNINDKYDIVKVLLDNGAKVNLRDKHGHTALYYAKRYATKTTIDLIESKGGIIM